MSDPRQTTRDALGAFESIVRKYRHYPSESFRRTRLDEIAAAKAWLRTIPTTDTSPVTDTGEGTGIGGPTP